MRVLMLVRSDLSADSRVQREATALAAQGHAVHVIGREGSDRWAAPDGVTVSVAAAGSGLRREAAATAGAPRTPPPHLRAARWALLPQHNAKVHRAWTAAAAREAHGREADVVHAHDFNTLELGAGLAAERGAKLVYDSHELWSGRPRASRPIPLLSRREVALERELGARADAVLTVSPGIARVLGERYGWRDVQVVRNTFPMVDALDQLPDAPGGIVYAGRLGPHRDLETVAAAAPALAPLRTTLVGPRDDTWLRSFDAGAVDVRASLPLAEADALLVREGLSLVTLLPGWPNHMLALPNKLFHAVRVGVPVVASDLPEMGALVRRYGLGTLYTPGDAGSLAAAVREAVARWPELTASVRAARDELCWENDAGVLCRVYERLG